MFGSVVYWVSQKIFSRIILLLSLSSATPCCLFTFLSHCLTHLQHLLWFCISVSASLICSKIVCFFFHCSVSWVFLVQPLSRSATAAVLCHGRCNSRESPVGPSGFVDIWAERIEFYRFRYQTAEQIQMETFGAYHPVWVDIQHKKTPWLYVIHVKLLLQRAEEP